MDATREPETGLLGGDLPFVRLGSGPRTLAVFPPIDDALRDATTGARFLALYYRALAEEYTVYFASRRRGLPPGYTTREMAADYTRAFEQDIGPAHVMGLSLGGLVAQRFATEYPRYVRSLVVGVAAHRLGTEGREIVRRWISRAREERWRELHAEMMVAMYEGLRRPLYEILVRLFGNALVRNPAARTSSSARKPLSATTPRTTSKAYGPAPWLSAATGTGSSRHRSCRRRPGESPMRGCSSSRARVTVPSTSARETSTGPSKSSSPASGGLLAVRDCYLAPLHRVATLRLLEEVVEPAQR